MECIVCHVDDGLALLCGRHWAEHVAWQRTHPPLVHDAHDDEAPTHPHASQGGA